MSIATPRLQRLLLAALAVVVISIGQNPAHFSGAIQSQLSGLTAHSRSLPLLFQPNNGQFVPDTHFLLHASQWLLQFESSSIVMSILAGQHQATDSTHASIRPIRMQFDAVDDPQGIVGEDIQRAKANYYRGEDPAKWYTQVPSYGRVRYQSLYPGIDLVFYASDKQLEYDFVIAPDANPSQIEFGIDGSEAIRLNRFGDLEIEMGGGVITMQAPHAYQYVENVKQVIESQFVLLKGRVSFDIGEYDHRLPLIIDPVLTSVSYLGGSGDDWGRAVVVDAVGNTYVTGKTLSTNFPLSTGLSGGSDVFVAKYNPAGQLLATTIIGSNDAISFFSDQEQGNALELTGHGDLLVTGRARPGFPTMGDPVYRSCTSIGSNGDAFLVRLDSDLNLIYSSCFGGSRYDEGLGIAEDSQGRMVIVGVTNSDDLPVTDGLNGDLNTNYNDGFIAVIDPVAGALDFGSYITGALNDEVHSVVASATDAIVVAGVTNSFALSGITQSTHGQSDVFVIQYGADYSREYGRLLGGSGDDGGFVGGANSDRVALAVDAQGKSYITATTTSVDLATTGGAGSVTNGGKDVLVARLTGQGGGDDLRYFGGSGDDYAAAIAVDQTGERVVIGGRTTSLDLPTISGVVGQHSYFGDSDAFVARLDQLLALDYTVYLGGLAVDSASGVALHDSGAVTVVGSSDSTDLIAADNTLSNGVGSDAFVVQIAPAIHDLEVAGAGSGGVAATGEVRQAAQIYYELNIVNNGPDVAQDVVVTAVLPAEIELIGIPTSCVSSPGLQGSTNLSCDFGELAPTTPTLLAFDVNVLTESEFTVDVMVNAALGSIDKVPLNNEIHIDASPVSPFIVRTGAPPKGHGGGGGVLWGLIFIFLGSLVCFKLHEIKVRQ